MLLDENKMLYRILTREGRKGVLFLRHLSQTVIPQTGDMVTSTATYQVPRAAVVARKHNRRAEFGHVGSEFDYMSSLKRTLYTVIHRRIPNCPAPTTTDRYIIDKIEYGIETVDTGREYIVSQVMSMEDNHG